MAVTAITSMKHLIAALVLGMSTLAHATPVTFYFAGEVSSYLSGPDINVADPSKEGLAFSGSITYDVSNGVLSVSTDPFNPYVRRVAQSGCAATVDGVCQSALPIIAPVVTDFQLTLEGVTYGRMFAASDAAAESSYFQKIVDSASSVLVVDGGSSKNSIEHGPAAGEVLVTTQARELRLIAGAFDPAWAGDPLDQSYVPDLSLMDAAYLQFGNLINVCHIVTAACEPGSGFTAESFQAMGTITYLSLSPQDTSTVPEPGSLALLGLGLAGLAALRKRQSSVN